MSLHRSLYLLTIPALALGWLLGGIPRGAHLDEQAPTKAGSKSPRAPSSVPALPNFLAPDTDGREPSFVDVSLRILERAEHADAAELARLKHELDDARYQTHPGYQLARLAVSQHHVRRASEQKLEAVGPMHSRRTLFLKWGARDLRSAFEAALRTPPPGQRVFNLRAALQRGAARDPELALDLVRSIPEARLRNRVAYQALRQVLRVNPGSYAKLVREFPAQARYIYAMAFGGMARDDPAAALDQLAEVPPEHLGTAKLALMNSWSGRDHAAAFRWARENGVPVTEEAMGNWMKADPIPALEAAVEGGFESRNLNPIGDLANMMNEVGAENQDEIAKWINALDDDSLRARLTAGLFQGEGAPSAAVLEAARFAADHPDSNLRNLTSLVRRIEDPRKRREFITSLPAVVGRAEMAWHAGEWLRDDSSGFAAYVEKLPTRRAREFFFNQALSNGNYEHRDALQQFAVEKGIRKPPAAP